MVRPGIKRRWETKIGKGGVEEDWDHEDLIELTELSIEAEPQCSSSKVCLGPAIMRIVWEKVLSSRCLIAWKENV